MSNSEELRVLFPDKTLLRLQIVGGVHTATADEIVSFVVEELELGDEGRNLFSLWIMSPSLELQLKPNHVLYHIVNQWMTLVEKHGQSQFSDNEGAVWSQGGLFDEIPVVVFRRNVFYPIEKEKVLICQADFPENARRLLYAEAAQNVLCGRLVSGDILKYHEMAGLRATIEFSRYNADVHTDEYYENRLHMLYPEHVINGKNSPAGNSFLRYFATGPCADSLRRKFIQHARNAHRQVLEGPYGSFTVTECQQRYLSICSDLPIYASAFYNAKLRLLGRLWGSNDLSVIVAINGYGVCVLEENSLTLLTALSYRYVTPILDKETNSLHLKFTTKHGTVHSSPSSASSSPGGGSTKSHDFVLVRDVHLISKQVVLMEALIKTFAMLHDEKARRAAPQNVAETANGQKAKLMGPVQPSNLTTQRQISRREQEFWRNKYSNLRLPSFRKESAI